VRRALEEPVRIISTNGGFEASVLVDKILSNTNASWGFNASSVSSLLLTTDAMISEKPKRETAGAGAGMGGMGDFDM